MLEERRRDGRTDRAAEEEEPAGAHGRRLAHLPSGAAPGLQTVTIGTLGYELSLPW
jgi:hypothetical protein